MPSVRPAPILVSQRQIWDQDFYTAPILNTLPKNFYYKVCNKQIENFFNTCKTMLILIVGFLVILHPQTPSETPSFSGGVCEFEVCNCVFLYVCAHLWWGHTYHGRHLGCQSTNTSAIFHLPHFMSKRLVGLQVCNSVSDTHLACLYWAYRSYWLQLWYEFSGSKLKEKFFTDQ